MEKAKGIATENFSVKGKWGKLTSLPGHITESIENGIKKAGGKNQHEVVVDPSRIYGYGHTKTGFGRKG